MEKAILVLGVVVAVAVGTWLGWIGAKRCQALRDGCNRDIYSNCIDYEHECVRGVGN